MKLDSVAEILKVLIPSIKARTVLVVSPILMIVFGIVLKFPEVLDFFGLGTWRANNESLLGWGTLVSFLFFILTVSMESVSWLFQKVAAKRQEQREQLKYKNLSSEELLYLSQFIHHRSTLVEFDSTDPVVGLLSSKGFIYQSTSAIFPHTSTPRFRWSYDYSKAYEISPEIYKYLNENVSKLLHIKVS